MGRGFLKLTLVEYSTPSHITFISGQWQLPGVGCSSQLLTTWCRFAREKTINCIRTVPVLSLWLSYSWHVLISFCFFFTSLSFAPFQLWLVLCIFVFLSPCYTPLPPSLLRCYWTIITTMSRRQPANYYFVSLITRCLIFKASFSTEMDITFMSLSAGFVGGGVETSGGTKMNMSALITMWAVFTTGQWCKAQLSIKSALQISQRPSDNLSTEAGGTRFYSHAIKFKHTENQHPGPLCLLWFTSLPTNVNQSDMRMQKAALSSKHLSLALILYLNITLITVSHPQDMKSKHYPAPFISCFVFT